MSETTESEFQPFTPDPALRCLDPLVGEWTMTGNLVGSRPTTSVMFRSEPAHGAGVRRAPGPPG